LYFSENQNYKLIIDYSIVTDEMNPRTHENLGKLICFHKKYSLGDKHNYNSALNLFSSLIRSIYPTETGFKRAFSKCNSEPEFINLIKRKYLILPVYMLDHSGIWLQTYPFAGHSWDSGLVGYIFANHRDIKELYDIRKLSQKYLEMAEDRLIGEVYEYANFIVGNVFYFKLINKSDNSIIDLCDGIIAEELSEIKRILKCFISDDFSVLIDNLEYITGEEKIYDAVYR